MNAARLVAVGFVFALLLACPVAAGECRGDDSTPHDVVTRLDEMLRRIDLLEQRISRIERIVFSVMGEPDRHGILRDATGRPIGIWGVDQPWGIEKTRLRGPLTPSNRR